MSATSLVWQPHDADDEPRAVLISPAVPPAGGFAVAADDMDETLLDLVDITAGRRVRPAPGGERVLVDDGGAVRRAVQTGAVTVDTRSGPALVHVDVRRSSAPCAEPTCVQVVREAGHGATPSSTLAVVVGAGVEVRAQAWAGTPGLASPVGATPPLSTRALLDLAGDPVWRDQGR